MNKFLVYILNHPLVRVFLTILSYFIYPIHNIENDQPATPKKLTTKLLGTKTKTDNDNETNDTTLNDTNDTKNDTEVSSTSSSPINKNNLFPTTITNNNVFTNSSIKPCSTGLSTKFLPFKNNQGEIEWTFADDDSSIHSVNGVKLEFQPHAFNDHDFDLENDHDHDHEHDSNEISPTVSNSSSNNESILSNNLNNQYPLNYGKSNGFNVETENLLSNSGGHTPRSLNTPSPPLSAGGESKCHQCPHCEATFKLRGYLTRHLKKHSIKKAYSCPFHKFSIYIDENNITHKCHPTGGFSRRDTYKTHLKSRHFKYPKGTKTKDRAKSSGNCSMCGEYFPNSEIWCEIHIEGGECKFLPQGFKGKSRIKNRLKKELKKKGYNINSDEPIDYSKLVNEISRQSNSSDLDDYDQKDDSSSPFSNSDLSQSPVSETHGIRMNGGTSSPLQMNPMSQSLPTNMQMVPQVQVQPQVQPQAHLSQSLPHNQQPMVIPQQPQHQQHQHQQQHQQSQPQGFDVQVPPQHQQHQHQHQHQQEPYFNDLYDGDSFYYKILDYDDEFCLDVDQLNQFDAPEANRTAALQQQYQAMQNQLQMNLMMYQQQRQSHQQSHQNQNVQPQLQGHYQGYYQEGFNSMSTGLTVDDIHLDSNLQPQYVQY